MIGQQPEFYTSKYFNPETWKLARDAPTNLKNEFDEYMEMADANGFERLGDPIPLPTVEEGGKG